MHSSSELNFIFIVIFYIFSLCFCQGPPPPPAAEEPQFILNFDSPVYVCPDDASRAWVDTSEIELNQFNETTATMSGIVNFLKGMDHSTMVIVEIQKESAGNRYEMVVTHEVCDLCSEISDKDSSYQEYLQYFGFPETCPFEPGQYGIHDLIADTSEIPVKKSNEGRYQITITMFVDEAGACKDGTFLACMKLDLVIEEATE